MSTPSSPSRTPSPKKTTKMKNDKVKISAKVKKSSHPPTSVMVTAAINELNERKGSSLPAIKKYIAGNYEVDAEKLAPFIKKHIKKAVEAGDLIQTSGRGANGSFKFPPKSKPKIKKAAVAAPKEQSGESENDSQSQSESEDEKEDTPPKATTSRPRKQLPAKNEKSVTKKETKANSKELKKSKAAEPTKEKTTAVKSHKKSKSKSPKKQAK